MQTGLATDKSVRLDAYFALVGIGKQWTELVVERPSERGLFGA